MQYFDFIASRRSSSSWQIYIGHIYVENLFRIDVFACFNQDTRQAEIKLKHTEVWSIPGRAEGLIESNALTIPHGKIRMISKRKTSAAKTCVSSDRVR